MGVRRPKWQMTVAEGKKFKRLVLADLKTRGVKPNKGGYLATMYDQTVPTEAGQYMVDVRHADEGTIFGRFANVKKGHACVRNSNPHSGKWNFHYGRETASRAFSDWKRQMDRLAQCGDK